MANTIKIKRGSGSDPSASDMVLGEPVLRTDTAELFFKKDDGSVAKVSGGGGGPDFKYLELRNAANNGAASYPANDFTLVTSGTTNAITPVAANTLLVSVNGIIQKPNAGTSTSGITGFIVDGSRFKTAANLSAAPDFILYQESGGIGEPSDNTVTSAKIVDGSIVNADINASAAIAGTKISPDFGSQNTTTTGIAAVGELQITSTAPKILFIDSDTDPDYELRNMNGVFRLRDSTNDIIRITQTGSITNVAGHVDIGAGLDVTGAITASTSITATGNLTTNGNFTISGTNPNIFLTDTNNDSDFRISNSNGILEFRDLTNTSTRLQIDSSGNVQIPNDSVFLQIGAGQDLDLHHNGTNSYIRNKTGDLHIRPLVSEEGIILKPNGAVELYHDNSKKFETTSGGVQVTDNLNMSGGHIFLADNYKLNVGTGDDLQIYHDPQYGHSFIKESGSGGLIFGSDLYEFYNAAISEKMLTATQNGAIELYHDNSKKFETTSTGATVTGQIISDGLQMGDNEKAKFGSHDDLQLYHDGLNSYIRENGTGSLYIDSNGNGVVLRGIQGEDSIVCNANGDVELYYDNTKKLETKSFGASISGSLEVTAHVYAPDNGKLLLGNAQDFELFHDSSVSIIRSSSHPIAHYSNTRHHFLNADGSENMAVFTTNGACELYHDGTKRIFTEANGGAIGGTSRFLGHGNATGANATEVHFNSNSGHFGIHFAGHGNTGNTYTAARMVINGTGGTYGTITYSLSGTGYNSQSSDRRSKKNIVEWTESELDKFKNLQPKLFHFDHNINSDPKYKGYIAQDNLAAFPEAYPLVDDRYMFNPSGMVVYLMKAVQELAAKVEALENK